MDFATALEDVVGDGMSNSRFPRVDAIREALSPADLVSFQDAMRNPTIQTTAIAKALVKLGHTISPERLGAYRRSLR